MERSVSGIWACIDGTGRMTFSFQNSDYFIELWSGAWTVYFMGGKVEISCISEMRNDIPLRCMYERNL